MRRRSVAAASSPPLVFQSAVHGGDEASRVCCLRRERVAYKRLALRQTEAAERGSGIGRRFDFTSSSAQHHGTDSSTLAAGADKDGADEVGDLDPKEADLLLTAHHNNCIALVAERLEAF